MKQKPNTEKELSEKILTKSENLFPVVGIGASAGGLDAFKKLIKAIPENSGMAYVLVQHLDPNHESLLPEILQRITSIPVLEITDDIKVLPDHIYVIPSNKMMVATDGVLLLAPRPPKGKNERNLPIDLFFASLAEVHQEHAIGVVLSGTASDGTQGLKAIKEQGGITFAQDETSAEYDSMPNSAAMAGVVDFILPPEEIPKKLLEVTSKSILSDEELQNIPKQDEDVFKQILSLLRIRKGVDFTYYKQTTIRRRILRRMVVNKNEETAEYLKFLRGNNPEQDLLYQDMLIPVTSFFRDKKVFENLCNNVFPAIIKNKVPGEITRVWIAGCSTGQEVYSFAICFKEFLGDNHERIQIFGTDLSEPAILKARTGIYEKTELDSVSPERMKEYFTKNNGGYQVNKSIRDLCVFAHHNFLKDPPFGKMDCISCRNVLIYMEPYLQKKALTTFHYALNPNGFLLLGKSETTGGVPDLFAPVGKNDKLYTRKDVPGRFIQVASQRSEQILNRPANSSKSETIRTDFQKTADDILLTKYTPAGVVVNETMDIVHFRGNTSTYLEQAPGKPSHNLLTMAKNGLGFELRNILHKAKIEKVSIIKENIPLSVNGNLLNISIEAVPLPNTLEPYYLILFHDNNLNDNNPSVTTNRKKISAKTKKEEKDIQIQLLEQELAQAREDMRSITEDQEASNEELQSANEELLSGSEELQSLNEELETSKEELQSTNEELSVLNHELIGLNEQVTDAKNYSESIVATLYQPLLVLDKHLRVKSANQAFYKIFKVYEKETEGVLIYDLGNRQWNIPELRNLLEEILPQKKQITDFEVTHNFTSIGQRVILLSALELTREKKEEKLILLSIEDVTEKKKFEQKEKEALELQIESEKKIAEAYKIANAKVNRLFLEAPAIICVHKGPLHVYELSNTIHQQAIGYKDVLGKPVREAFPELEGTGIYELLDRVYSTGEPFVGNEFPIQLDRGNGNFKEGYFNFVYQPTYNSKDELDGILVHGIDVTEQVLSRKIIEANKNQLQNIFLNAPAAIAIFEGPQHKYILANKAYEKLSNRKAADLLGKSMEVLFPELIGTGTIELFDKVLETGESFSAPEYSLILDLENEGVLRQYYFNFSMEPLRNDSGEIYAVMAMTFDITEQVEAGKKIKETEKQKEFLLKISDALRPLENPVDIEEAVTKIALDFMDADWCHYCTIKGDKLIILRDAVRGDLPSLAGVYPISNFALFKVVLDAGCPFIVDDVHTTNIFDEDLKQLCIQLQNISFICVPIIKNGKPLGMLSLVQSKLRKWTDSELQLTIQTAERTWAAVERATAEEALRQNEEKYRSLFNSIDQGFALCELVRNKEGKGIDYYMLEGNSNYEKQSGVSMEMMLGKSLLQVFPTVDKWWIETYAAVVDDQRPAIFEKYFEITHRWFEVNAYPVSKDRFAILFNDITERRQAEDKLKESENRFRTMADASPVLIWTLDAKGLSTYYNKTFLDFLGVLKDQDISNWEAIVHPDDVQLMYNILNAAIAEHSSYSLELRLLRADGQWRWVLAQGNPRTGINNEFMGFVGSSVDITERKQAEEKIKESEKRYNIMLMKSPFAFAVLKGKDMVISLANDSVKAMWGKGNDVEGKPLINVLPELKNSEFPDLLDKVYTTGNAFTGEELLAPVFRNGKLEDVYFNFVYQPYLEADETISGVTVIAYEVTSTVIVKKALEAQREAEQKALKQVEETNKRYYGMLMESPFAFSIMKGKDMVITLANDLMKEFWGKGLDIEGKTLLQMLPELKDHPFPKMINKAFNTGKPVYANEILAQFQHSDKLVDKYFNIVNQPLHEADNTISGVITIAYDVTEMVLSRKKVEKSESISRTILENNPDCVKILDSEGRLNYMNENGQCLLGIDDFSLYENKFWWELWENKDKKQIKEAVANAKKGKKTQMQLAGNTIKGIPKWWDIIVSPMQQLEGNEILPQIISISRDITNQKNQQLKEKELLDRFQILVLQAPVAIIVLRGENYILEIINQSMEEFLDTKKEDILNKPIFEVLTELNGQGFKELLDNVLKNGERFIANELLINVKRNGKLENAFVTFVYEPLREDDGTISGVMVLAHEITEQVVGRKKMEAQAKLHENMLMTAPGFVCTLVGPTHIYYLVNDRYQQIFGNHELKGKPIFEALPELQGQGFDVLLDKVYKTGESYIGIEVPTVLAKNKGEKPQTCYFNFSYQPMYNEFDEIYAILVFGYEVTEQVNARIKNLETRQIREAELENQVQKRTVELSEVNAALQKGNDEKEKRSKELVIANKKLEIESKEKEKKAEELVIANIKLEFESNEKEKKARELIIANKKLEFESSEKEKRAAELVIANHELAYQNEEKEKRTSELVIANKELLAFNYISSHDLQEPLRKIQTFSSRIIEREYETLSANGKDYFIRINSAAKRMQTLIEDLLTYSHTNITDRKFEKVDFEELIEEIRKDLKETIKTKKAKVKFSGDNIAKINRFQFRQVLYNLIGNALKFSRSDVNPIISITGKIDLGKSFKSEKDSTFPIILSADKKYFQLKFTDNGIGFDSQYSTKIFDVFQRLHGREEYAGTGIGLAIVKKIIDNHNGFIAASGKINEGATFVIYIPA